MMVTQDYFDNRYHPVNNPEGTMATPNMGNYSNARKATAASNIYFKDASYALLRNLKLAYNLPSALLGKVGINKAQVYVLGNNLFMLTGYKDSTLMLKVPIYWNKATKICISCS